MGKVREDGFFDAKQRKSVRCRSHTDLGIELEDTFGETGRSRFSMNFTYMIVRLMARSSTSLAWPEDEPKLSWLESSSHCHIAVLLEKRLNADVTAS